jgi:hypothetical protein
VIVSVYCVSINSGHSIRYRSDAKSFSIHPLQVPRVHRITQTVSTTINNTFRQVRFTYDLGFRPVRIPTYVWAILVQSCDIYYS